MRSGLADRRRAMLPARITAHKRLSRRHTSSSQAARQRRHSGENPPSKGEETTATAEGEKTSRVCAGAGQIARQIYASVFTAQRTALAVVQCPSVRPSHAGIVSKRVTTDRTLNPFHGGRVSALAIF